MTDPIFLNWRQMKKSGRCIRANPADSENYIILPPFCLLHGCEAFRGRAQYCQEIRGYLYGTAEEESKSMPGGRLEVSRISTMLASADGAIGAEASDDAASGNGPEETEEDYSNGRFEIFKRYISHWNLTGHDEMGVELADGSLSVHAHNTYLQVIHDHGLITGAVYLILGAVSLMQMFRYAYWAGRKKREDSADPYAALPLAIFLAFAVAGLVEWLFHPCNPLGFSTMAVLAPLLIFRREKKV